MIDKIDYLSQKYIELEKGFFSISTSTDAVSLQSHHHLHPQKLDLLEQKLKMQIDNVLLKEKKDLGKESKLFKSPSKIIKQVQPSTTTGTVADPNKRLRNLEKRLNLWKDKIEEALNDFDGRMGNLVPKANLD